MADGRTMAMASGGLLARLKAERELLEALDADGGELQLTVERREGRTRIALARAGRLHRGEGPDLATAWHDTMENFIEGGLAATLEMSHAH